jgi:hypothetical protein
MAVTERALTVRFSQQQAATLARVAELEDRSKGSVIRRLVDQLDSRADDRAVSTITERTTDNG